MAALGEPVRGAPADGVTNVRFSSTGETLLASSWDGVCSGGSGLVSIDPICVET